MSRKIKPLAQKVIGASIRAPSAPSAPAVKNQQSAFGLGQASTLNSVNGKLTATNGIGVGNSAAATTLGSVTKKMEVFDAGGTSLGFVPIYDAIT